MSGNLTDTTDRAILNWITGTSLGGWTPPTTGYVALLTVDPSTTAAIPTDPQLSELTELTATGYSRQVVTWTASTSPTNGTSQIQNSNLVTFGPFTATSGSGTPTTFGALVTTASGTTGEVIAVWEWDIPVLAPQNQSITVPIADITLTQQQVPMAFTMQDIINRVRIELGDTGAPFSDTFLGTGMISTFDLTEFNIWNETVTWIRNQSPVILTKNTDYTMNYQEGRIFLIGASSPLPQGDTLVISGQASGMFSDEELEDFINDAVLQHTNGRTIKTRFKDSNGFIKYAIVPIDLSNLPDIEGTLVALRATIDALWALATDASTDIDISSADGTTVPRSQRYQQLREQIEGMTERYQQLCAMLNIGLNRIEMSKIRRVSKTTNRLVPIFEDREYDDYEFPRRQLPPIDTRDEDESNLQSPIFGGMWGL